MTNRPDTRAFLIFRAANLVLGHLPRIDAHLHTSWTDGKGTVAEVHAEAVKNGLEAILFSEHSRKSSVDWFPTFVSEVRSLPGDACRAFVGTECKIESSSGEIDTIPAISDLCDLVMASVHRFPAADGSAIPFDQVRPEEAVDREYRLSMAVLENTGVDILGHMFGMSLRRYGSAPSRDQQQDIIRRAAKSNIAIELNSHYHPNMGELLSWCREFDALVTFGSNAHTLENVGRVVRDLENL